MILSFTKTGVLLTMIMAALNCSQIPAFMTKQGASIP